MRGVVRTLILLLVFAGVGWLTDRAVLRHVGKRGAMESEVRLGSATAGLFAGGAATLIVGIAMFWPRGARQDR